MGTEVPENMKTKRAFAINQDKLARQRTELSIIRTKLAFYNSNMSVSRTHLSYLRTIVSLIGSGATIYKALPAIGVSAQFSTALSLFLFACAAFFIYKDMTVYPKMKKYLKELEAQTDEIKEKTMNEIYDFEEGTC